MKRFLSTEAYAQPNRSRRIRLLAAECGVEAPIGVVAGEREIKSYYKIRVGL